MRAKIILNFLISVCIAFASSPGDAKTYTRSELRALILKKKSPKTEEPRVESKPMSFEDCSLLLYNERIEKDERGYPTKVLKETKDVLIIKWWLSHQVSIISCVDGEYKSEDAAYAL